MDVSPSLLVRFLEGFQKRGGMGTVAARGWMTKDLVMGKMLGIHAYLHEAPYLC